MRKKLKGFAYDNYLSIAKSVTHTFISVVLFLLPLAITNAYYNITETKLITFYILSSVFIIIQLFLFLSFVVNEGKDFLKSLCFKLNFLDISFVLFGLSYVLSGMFSKYGSADVLWGIGSRYQGIVTIVLYVLLYFILTRTFSFSLNCLLWAGVSFSIVSVIAILNGFSVDPLGFYSELSAKNKKLYISTIGNINFYSAYYNLMLPMFVVGFCKAMDKRATIVFGSFIALGSIGMVFTASESFLLGFIISMLLLLAFVMTDANVLKRFLVTCCLFLATITIYTNLYYNNHAQVVLNFTPSAIMKFISNPVIISILVVCLFLLFVFAHKKPEFLPYIKKIFCISLVIGFVLSVAVIVLLNTTFKNLEIGVLDDYLRFSERWGTNRGRNWSFCIKEFIDAPLISKIFGFGPETYRNLTAKTGFYKTQTLDQAHNEYLQYLISVGIIGLMSYLGIIIGVIKSCIKKVSENAVAMSILCCLIAYWVQASVNIAQPFTTPLMFIFISILSSMSSLQTSKKEKSGRVVL